MLTYLAIGIFVVSFLFIALDVFDKSLVALLGSLLMVIVGILTPEEAIAAIDFDTIFLLLAMMIIVNIASRSGIFSWLNIRIAHWTKGNPLLIFLLFSSVTALCSAFLDNVSTVILIVPLTIELLRGMGKDPKPYIFAEIFFSNIGGGLTLIGDASNIIIGGASGLSFVEFIANLWIPILGAAIFAALFFVIVYRKEFKSIDKSLVDLCAANLLIRKIQQKFLKITIHKDFIIKVVGVLFLTILGFVFQKSLGLPNYVIAFSAATLLSIATAKRVEIHEALETVEWTTLFFFAGLFIMVGGIEKTGLLEQLSSWIANSTDNIFYLSLIVLWVSGAVSMLLDNIPFVTVMVPVIIGIESKLIGMDTSVLWWALSLGACLGGTGTIIGASANVVSIGLARKDGLRISFFGYMKFAFPLTFCMLLICSTYLFFRTI